jgi:hypothetical protein
METAEPASITLSLDEAFEFLQEWAWVLEDAGFRIIIPARLTPKGRQRAKMRLRSGNTRVCCSTPAPNCSAINLW